MKNNELKTSLGNIAKLPTGLKKLADIGYKKVLNYGAGLGYKFHTELLKGRMELINYDPYIEDISKLEDADVECVVCNNVLNVIEDDRIIDSVLDTLESFKKPIYITIYEGDRTGNKRVMKGGTYQRHTKSKDYNMLEKRGYTFKTGMWIKEL